MKKISNNNEKKKRTAWKLLGKALRISGECSFFLGLLLPYPIGLSHRITNLLRAKLNLLIFAISK